jgi:hypothetical protein
MTITFYQKAFTPDIVKTNNSPWQNVPLKVTVATSGAEPWIDVGKTCGC